MKINNICTWFGSTENKQINFASRRQNALNYKKFELDADTFEKSSKVCQENDIQPLIDKLLDDDEFDANLKNKKFLDEIKNNKAFMATNDKDEYLSISKKEKDYRLKKIDHNCFESALGCTQGAKLIKELYDKDYGKDKWAFISVGTSPAGVARALEFMDEDVRYMPISKLTNAPAISKITKSKVDKMQNPAYKKFLNSIGIDKEKVEKEDKTLVFVDYTASGKTLKRIEEAILELDNLPEDKTSFRSINEDLANCVVYNEKDDYLIDIRKCIHDMGYCEIQKYSGIPHLEYDKTDEIINCIPHKQEKEEKNFNFALLYILEAMELLKKQ